jgi:nitrilase
VVEWVAATYDDVLIAVLGNPEKPAGLYTPDERVRLIELATEHLPNVRGLAYNGLTGNLAREHNASVIVRSAHKEADTERLLAVLNKFMSGGVPTEFAPADPATESVSSTAVRDLLAMDRFEEAAAMVPEPIRSELATAERIPPPAPPASGPVRPARSRPGVGPMTVGRRVRPAKVVAVQDRPVLLDRDATLDRALGLVEQAATEGADLVTLPEAFLPGYPEWAARIRPGHELAEALYGDLFDNAVVVGSAVTQVLGMAAQRFGAYLSIGVTEREATGSALYSSQLLFGPDRELLSVRRKTMLSGPEKLVWSPGDDAALEVVETPFGRIATLVGWESYLPSARAELYAQGADIYLAPGWNYLDPWPMTLRHIGREGGVFVVATAQCLSQDDLPGTLPGLEDLYPEGGEWLARGGTVIVGPDGDVMAGPLEGQTGMVAVRIDANQARHARRRFPSPGR